MFEILLSVPASDWLVILLFVVLAYVILLTAVVGTLALAARRAGPPELYRIGPVVFRVRPIPRRLRLWQFLVAILVIGVVFEFVILARHVFYAYEKAQDHEREASVYHFLQDPGSLLRFSPRVISSKPVEPGFPRYCRAMETYHEQLSQKYFDVARHPWRSASADAPEPDLTEHVLQGGWKPGRD